MNYTLISELAQLLGRSYTDMTIEVINREIWSYCSLGMTRHSRVRLGYVAPGFTRYIIMAD